jgi:opacity protein-like surface antigen
MKKKRCVLGVAVVLACLLALSGVAQSAMWVGAQIGGNFQPYPNISINGYGYSSSFATEVRPSVIGGATLGYDFVNSGFGAYAWPDWMKYFSFAMDLTYNRLCIQDRGPGIGQFFANDSRLNGYQVALSFLFRAQYGFLPDSEVPTGRIVPYIGVGPAIIWTGVQYTVPTVFHRFAQFSSNGGDDAMNVALVVEPGVRFMCMKNVSVDTAFRYRYSQPSWSDDNVTIKVPLHQMAFLVRANYHF